MKNINFILIIITIIILTVIGLAFLYGTVYSSIQTGNWTETPAYQNYLTQMNDVVLPFTLALIIVLGICIPKRLFSGATLLKVNGVLLLLTMAAALIFNPQIALGFLFAVATAIQLIVITLTLVGSKRLKFERAGFFLQLGSAFLHLGLVVFLFDFILLSESPSHLSIFWLATLFIGVGMLFSFYHQELHRLFRIKEPPAVEEESLS